MRSPRTLDRDVPLLHMGGDGEDGPSIGTSDPSDVPAPAPAAAPA